MVVSFSRKVFRTRVIRHNLNPTWDEKLLFHVHRFETEYKIQLTLLDWDKLSGNDHIADAWINVSELIALAPKPDPETGLYPDPHEDTDMKSYTIPLEVDKEAIGEGKHHPTITFK